MVVVEVDDGVDVDVVRVVVDDDGTDVGVLVAVVEVDDGEKVGV